MRYRSVLSLIECCVEQTALSLLGDAVSNVEDDSCIATALEHIPGTNGQLLTRCIQRQWQRYIHQFTDHAIQQSTFTELWALLIRRGWLSRLPPCLADAQHLENIALTELDISQTKWLASSSQLIEILVQLDTRFLNSLTAVCVDVLIDLECIASRAEVVERIDVSYSAAISDRGLICVVQKACSTLKSLRCNGLRLIDDDEGQVYCVTCK